MKFIFASFLAILFLAILFPAISPALFQHAVAEEADSKSSTKTSLQVLFIGNSYTARHQLADVVKRLFAARDPALQFDYHTVIYGGRTLADHWRLGTANEVRRATLTKQEQEAMLQRLEERAASDPKDRYAAAAVRRHRQILKELESGRRNWDVVVLQSYRDDLTGDPSLYGEYAAKFAELAKQMGARVVLYETTPTTQNAQAVTAAPQAEAILPKTKSMARLANRIDASIAPMSWVAMRCQQKRPDLTLRFINDAHLNQTMAYLTACTLFAAISGESPVGSPVDSVTDIRFMDNKDRSKDRDGKPITMKFSAEDREQLQRLSWEAYQEFETLRKSLQTATK